jgi:hypothetical protein
MLEELRNHVAQISDREPANIVFTPELPRPFREDHAAAAPRRGREPTARRHHDPRRSTVVDEIKTRAVAETSE